jgi:hypothetical protein
LTASAFLPLIHRAPLMVAALSRELPTDEGCRGRIARQGEDDQ